MDSIINSETFVLFSIGSPGSGKTYLTKYLVYESLCKHKFNHVIIISSTGDVGSNYSYADPDYVHMEYSEELLGKIIKKQKETNLPALLILDDEVGKTDFRSNMFKHLMTIHRHLNLSIIICTQYLNTELPPILRNCITHAVWFKQEQLRSLKGLFESFGMRYSNLREFTDAIMELEKYEFILFDKSIDGMEAYQKLKAPSRIPNFQINVK